VYDDLPGSAFHTCPLLQVKRTKGQLPLETQGKVANGWLSLPRTRTSHPKGRVWGGKQRA